MKRWHASLKISRFSGAWLVLGITRGGLMLAVAEILLVFRISRRP